MEDMDLPSEHWLAALVSAVADLQAKTLAQDLMIEALTSTHPHPIALRDQWDRLVASMEVASMDSKARSGREDNIRPELSRQLARLTTLVERHAPRTP